MNFPHHIYFEIYLFVLLFVFVISSCHNTISSLIPIHLHLKKLYDRFLLKGFSLPPNHLIKLIINIDQSHN